jgi:hypothetical protein
MTREEALHRLLESLFDADELHMRLALGRDGHEIEGALPSGASRTATAFAAVQALRRHGYIDREFFDALRLKRPKRETEIREVRVRWLENGKLDRGERWAAGRYELDSKCGQSGFGIVWKAVDVTTGEFVALKILLEHHAEDHRVSKRFYRGAQVLPETERRAHAESEHRDLPETERRAREESEHR